MTLIETTHIKDYLKARKCKALSKKQLATVFELIDHKMQHAQLQGFNDGKKSIEASKSMESLRAAALQQTIIHQTINLLEQNSNIIQGIWRCLDEAK